MNNNNKMEFWTLYLPAFHRIKENDEWWGDGFTEWDNVRNGKSLYPGHVQPKVPLNGYYDLTKLKDIKMQCDIAKQYGITGFVMYHYWFGNGKKLLERPAEILLSNKEIEINYSFCWANEPWSRTWDGKNNDVLMPQDYGDENEWIEHIKYLLQFFRDDRYHKIDGRPVFYFYSASRITYFDRMIDCWNKVLMDNGLKELYVIEFISSFNKDLFSNKTSAVMEFEPLYTTRFDISFLEKVKRYCCKKLRITDYQDYDDIWRYILKRNRTYQGKTIIKSCFCAWDNSPRKGKNSMIVRNSSPEKFADYLLSYVKSHRKDASDGMIVINAWNEWGEGAMLEPSEYDGYKYLEGIKIIHKMWERFDDAELY